MSRLANEDAWPKGPPPQQSRAMGGDLSFRWRSGGDHGGQGGTKAGPEEKGRGGLPAADNDLAMLQRSLGGAKGNESGWPTFKGRCVGYPKFKKEWWAYRSSYHAHMRDVLLCQALKY